MEPRPGSYTRLTYVGVPPLIKLMGIVHREDAVGGGGREHAVANTHTHTVLLVIYWMDGASGENQTQS